MSHLQSMWCEWPQSVRVFSFIIWKYHLGLINVSTIIHVTTTTFIIEGTIIAILNMRKEAMEWEPRHSNLELSVVKIILDIIIVV